MVRVSTETQTEKTARHLSELSDKGFLPSPNARAFGDDAIILSRGRIRLDRGVNDVIPGDLVSQAELRPDYNQDLQEVRKTMADQGFLKAGRERSVVYMDLGAEQGQSMYATAEGKGGRHDQAVLIVPLRALDTDEIYQRVSTLRNAAKIETAMKAVDGKSDIELSYLAGQLGRTEDGREAMVSAIKNMPPTEFAEIVVALEKARRADVNKGLEVGELMKEQGLGKIGESGKNLTGKVGQGAGTEKQASSAVPGVEKAAVRDRS